MVPPRQPTARAERRSNGTLHWWLLVRRSAILDRCGAYPTTALQLRRLPEAYRNTFVSGLAVPSEAVSITGTMSTFTMPGGQSGEAMHRRFCTKCGSPILIEKDGTGRKLIMAGTLDDKSQFKPTISLFCEQAPSWVVMPTHTENLPRYYD